MAKEKRMLDVNAAVDGIVAQLENEWGYDGIREDVQRILDNTTTVDAVEVVHGRWVICSDGYYPYCSECKEEPKHGEMTKYCPNCGAKMDGGK